MQTILCYSPLAGRTLREDRQERLRRISIDKFYKIATGSEYAFAELCSVLGLVIDDVLKENPQALGENSVLKELEEEGADILKTLFISSFGAYQGFDEFKIRR